MKTKQTKQRSFLAAVIIAGSIGGMQAQNFLTAQKVMINGTSAKTGLGWKTEALVTVGEQDSAGNDVNFNVFGYKLPGILDGIGAFDHDNETVRILVNHEFGGGSGYAYSLANGTQLKGARVSYVDINKNNRKVSGMGMAYNKAYDRFGNLVTPSNNIGSGNGFNRFCSSVGIAGGEYGLAKDIYLTGEETNNGQAVAIDVDSQILYVAPMLGRASWENLAPVENYGSNYVALLIGDDRGAAPLYLYIGEKNASVTGYNAPNFLKANGLGKGQLYVWVADNGDKDPSQFKGTGSSRKGKFVKIAHFDASKAGTSGYDALGFPNQNVLDVNADVAKHFEFSRPEDVAVNPADATQVVLASTGINLFGGADLWGTTYLIDFDNADLKAQLAKTLNNIDNVVAEIKILYSGDDAGNGLFSGSDFGLRSPDNLDWADNGLIYIQEDKSVVGFGGTSGSEASVWELNPATGALKRILEMDRTAVPLGQTDVAPSDIGNWESSGILEVTSLFKKRNKYESLFIADVQGHSIRGGLIASATLVEGGQLYLISKNINPGNRSSAPGPDGDEGMKQNGYSSVYPNPFQTEIFVTYNLGNKSNVNIYVTDMNGRMIKQLVSTDQLAGEHSVSWDAVNTSGIKVESGVYQLVVETAEFKQIHQVVLAK